MKNKASKTTLIFLMILLTGNLSAQQKPTIEWVNILAGTFIMGTPENFPEIGADETQHQVTLSAFKMSKYEITFDQYDLFCLATGRAKPNDEGWGRGKRPVINVSWDDANAFAEWLGCRLPTEAEWEYACRAGTTTTFYTGDCLSTSKANYNGNMPNSGCKKGMYRKKTSPVGSFSANAWGLFDMHGNVSEWCNDWYAEYPTLAEPNPKGFNGHRVIRGGNWDNLALYCRSAARDASDQDYISNGIGFRLVAIN
jgi:formylglycine-generating enzyme required for sulfatase activity